ncbi:Metalloenzyme, LuxS/M16 peptidase-like protein [Phyllosticta citriasiana]|uniref:Metalloenzyme, LuxS/M16 peptidase-like protein n=1 Tax=Phyllosticta citriasiana TaxID=595635 RepID=UPI0030FDF6D6
MPFPPSLCFRNVNRLKRSSALASSSALVALQRSPWYCCPRLGGATIRCFSHAYYSCRPAILPSASPLRPRYLSTTMAEPVNSRTALPERLAENMERPALDDRTYRVIRLPNQLEALLIHDSDTDKVSAAMDVAVGSFSDDDDMPGMAHAVEHLLFMGTKKYPKENAYNQYLTANSGYANAFTASNNTNYYFELSATPNTPTSSVSSSAASSRQDLSSTRSHSPLYGALDRFAQFFVEPLFLEETLDRELRAVDSENKKNLQSDVWRLHQLNKTLSNPRHPYIHFSTGSYKTLHDDPLARGVKIRDEFIKFYETHYSANRMKLVVLGRESLNELESWVSQMFSEVKNKNLPRNRWDNEKPLTENELQTQIFAKPVFQSRNLDLQFAYPDEEDLYESAPGRYLSHLIGHEGPGSLMAYIKDKGWANDLGAGSFTVCPGSAFFTISIRLTEEGLKNHEEVLKHIFHYISMLKETEPQQWIFEEVKKMSEVDFRFKQKSPASNTTSSLSGIMQKPYPRDQLLSGPSVVRKFNPEAIKVGLSHLRPDNFRMTITSQDWPGDWDQKEKWYGTEYKYQKIPQKLRDEIKAAAASTPADRPKEFHLPHPNQFIPTRLEVERKEVSEPLKQPLLIRNDERVRLWYKKDDRFWVPKANVDVTLRTSLVSATPQASVMTAIYRDLVSDELSEYAYDAEVAGVAYSLSTSGLGLDVWVSGYNDKMGVLLERLLLAMRDLKVREHRFQIIKERMTRSFRNAEYNQPYYQVGGYLRWLCAEKGWINEELAAEVPHITSDDIRHFYPQLLKQTHIEVLAMGNLYKEDALKMADTVEKTLQARPLAPSQWPIRRNIIVPSGSNFVYERVLKDPANINHCIEYLCSIGENANRTLRAKALVFAQLVDEPAFNTLRTKEQLGYVVFSGAVTHINIIGFRVLIQSERTPEYLEERIDAFLNGIQKMIEDMPDEEFESHKEAVKNTRREKLRNLSQENSRFWTHICNETLDFHNADEDVAHIEPLTKTDILNFYHEHISPRSTTRAKVSVHMLAQDSKAPGQNLVSSISKFLTSQGVTTDDDALAKRFESVDIASGNVNDIVTAISAHLVEDLKLAAEKVQDVMTQGQAAIGQLLPSVAAAAAAAASNTDKADSATGQEEEAKGGPIKIADVRNFKASLQVSKGPTAVRELSEFEELEPKL